MNTKTKKLSFAQIILIVLFFLISSFFLYLVATEQNSKIKFVKDEIDGLDYLKPLFGRYSLLVKLSEVDNNAKPQTYKALNSLSHFPGNRFGTENVDSIFAKLDNKVIDSSSLRTVLNNSINKLRKQFSIIGNESKLILDPELKSYYLATILVEIFPTRLDYLSKISSIPYLENNIRSDSLIQITSLLQVNTDLFYNSINVAKPEFLKSSTFGSDVNDINSYVNSIKKNGKNRSKVWNELLAKFEYKYNLILEEQRQLLENRLHSYIKILFISYLYFAIIMILAIMLMITLFRIRKARAESEIMKDDLRELANHLQNIREEEQRKISRELHDELGQLLTVIKYEFAALKKKIKPLEENEDTILVEIQQIVNRAITSIREIAYDLRPAVLDNLGLFSAIESFIQQIQRKTNIKINLVEECNNLMFSENFSTQIYRIIQESVVNSIKHSDATNITIIMLLKNNSFVMNIEDNGTKSAGDRNEKVKLGIIGMKERAIILGGNLDVIYENGTKINLIIGNIDKYILGQEK